MRRSICLISISPLFRDGRVLRQVKYLAQHYDLTVIGYEPPGKEWLKMQHVRWVSIPYPHKRNLFFRVYRVAIKLLGRLWPGAYNLWYKFNSDHVNALKHACEIRHDVYQADEHEALPASVEAARRYSAKLMYDAHEYALALGEHSWSWKFLYRPKIEYVFRKYLPQVSASLTFAPLIAERFKQEYGINPIVVLNAPERVTGIQSKDFNPDHIQLIHHGAAFRHRRLETMIEALVYCDQRYTLNFMLIDNDPDYVLQLKRLAERLVPGRVTFHASVTPDEIVQRISKYDVGFYSLSPLNFNQLVALPNKFFDYIAAGLPVCIGPSPSMAEIVCQYGCGVIAESFAPFDLATALNRTSVEQWVAMREAAKLTSGQLNAENEMKKMLTMYRIMLGERQSA